MQATYRVREKYCMYIQQRGEVYVYFCGVSTGTATVKCGAIGQNRQADPSLEWHFWSGQQQDLRCPAPGSSQLAPTPPQPQRDASVASEEGTFAIRSVDRLGFIYSFILEH